MYIYIYDMGIGGVTGQTMEPGYLSDSHVKVQKDPRMNLDRWYCIRGMIPTAIYNVVMILNIYIYV